MVSVAFAVLALVLGLAVLTGCSRADDLELRDWRAGIAGVESPVALPVHLEAPRTASHYTLRTTATLPPSLRGRQLRFIFPYLPGITELYVADLTEPLREEGGAAATAGYRGAYGAHEWLIPKSATTGETLELRLVVAHSWLQSTWIDSVPRLGLAATPDTAFDVQRGVTELTATFALSTMVPIGFSYLLLFLLDRRRVANGWFSLQALTGTYLPLFVLGSTQRFLGTWDTCILAITQALAPYAGLRFTYATFGLGKPPRVLSVLIGASCVGALVFSGPFDGLPLAFVVILSISATLGFHIYTLLKLTRRTPAPPNARLLLVGWFAVMSSVVFEGPVFLGLGAPIGGARLGCVGLVSIAICQTIVLVRDYALSLRNADELNKALRAQVDELETRQRENEVLNDELRRQVAERSEKLSTTLARVSRMAGAPVLAANAIVDGRFRVARALGSGGMGSVYEVERVIDGRVFALKVMEGAPQLIRMARFAREGQLGARIMHRNVVGIVDVQVSPGGYLYLVMEMVKGRSLAAYKDRYGDVRWALEILAQVCEGLAAIHAGGIVHRDLKPSNILVESATGTVRITDFGISRQARATESAADLESSMAEDTTVPPQRRADLAVLEDAQLAAATHEGTSDLTQAGAFLGTPLWAAPETVSCATNVGRAADIWGVGLLAVLLLTGTSPRGARDKTLAGVVSPALASLVASTFEDDPNARPTGERLAAAFRNELSCTSFQEKAS